MQLSATVSEASLRSLHRPRSSPSDVLRWKRKLRKFDFCETILITYFFVIIRKVILVTWTDEMCATAIKLYVEQRDFQTQIESRGKSLLTAPLHGPRARRVIVHPRRAAGEARGEAPLQASGHHGEGGDGAGGDFLPSAGRQASPSPRRARTSTRTCTRCLSDCVCVFAHTRVHLCVGVHTYIHTYLHTCMHKNIDTYSYTYIHT